MPSNSPEYQREYRKRNARKRKGVSVALPIDDYLEIQSYARRQGLGLATVLREATLMQIRRSSLRSSEIESELKELRFLIANIANNVNQMARHSNRVKHLLDENDMLSEIMMLHKRIDEFVDTKLKNTL
jgi:hypothetical protein